MRRAQLRLLFSSDDDGTGELTAQVQADGFAAVGAAYFGVDELVTFADSLAGFPLPKDRLPKLAGGFWKSGSQGVLEQELLAIEVVGVDVHGHITIQVRAAKPNWNTSPRTLRRSATIDVVTTYEPLRRFAVEFGALVRGVASEAMLDQVEEV